MEVLVVVGVIVGIILFVKWLEYGSRYVVNPNRRPEFWDWLVNGENARMIDWDDEDDR